MEVENWKQYIANCLERIRRCEDALFHLMDADTSALIAAFGQEENRELRGDILHCIWQQRDPETIQFLAGVLRDPVPEVWKEALDGLVAIGGEEAINVLEAARARLPTTSNKGSITQDWIDEALDQVRETEP